MFGHKIHSRKRNITTLVILLLIFFLLDSILLSMTDYIEKRASKEYLEGRTLKVDSPLIYDAPAEAESHYKTLEAYLDTAEGVVSYVRDYEVWSVTYELAGQQLSWLISSCNYEGMKEYILTEDCKAPEDNEVIIPKYIAVGDYEFDMGSYFLSLEELDKDLTDGEALVGQTITATVRFFNWHAEPETVYVEKELKVIGVYDNYKLGETNAAYMNQDTMKEWQIERESYNNYVPPENLIVQNPYVYTYRVICENRKAMQALGTALEENYSITYYGMESPMFSAYNSSMISEMDVKVLNIICAIGNAVLAFFLVNAIINIIYTEEREIYARRKEYGLMKAVGYRNLQISLLHMKEVAISALIALALTFSLGGVMMLLLNAIGKPFLNPLFYTFKIEMKLSVSLVTVAILLVALGIGCSVGIYHLLKLQAAEALKSEESNVVSNTSVKQTRRKTGRNLEKKTIIIIAIATISVVLLLGGLVGWNATRKKINPDDFTADFVWMAQYDDAGNMAKFSVTYCRTSNDNDSRTSKEPKITCAYNDRGNITEIILEGHEKYEKTVTFTYDETGENVVEKVVEASAEVTAAEETAEYEYDAAGRLKRLDYGNVYFTYTYNSSGRCVQTEATFLDEVGNITRVLTAQYQYAWFTDDKEVYVYDEEAQLVMACEYDYKDGKLYEVAVYDTAKDAEYCWYGNPYIPEMFAFPGAEKLDEAYQ